ncbi:MAG: HU family DNA-binding protein, partial [Gammaproteobacteria bacterium]
REKFVLPGAFKIVVRKIPAKKARKGINPFTGQPAVFQAKPASRKVKIIALKSLKDMAI